jgi:tRNA(fMet)-specific endonuclease VapC
MNGRHLLDTNIVVALLNDDPEIKARIGEALEVFLSSVTLGELYFGAARSGRPEDNARRIDDFADVCTIVGVDSDTARHYGRVKHELGKRGRPIPENDVWIAACALQHGLVLATRDQHFEHVQALHIEAW